MGKENKKRTTRHGTGPSMHAGKFTAGAGKDSGKSIVESKDEAQDRRRDRDDERVRQLYADYLASAGVNSGRISVEVLFMLPIAFVRFYQDLFSKALNENLTPGGQQGSREKGELGKRSGMGSPGLRGKRVMVSGTGKRYRNSPYIVKDELALRVKDLVDSQLLRLIDTGRDELASGVGSEQPGGPTRRGSKCLGEKCGRFLQESWAWCPHCGTKVL